MVTSARPRLFREVEPLKMTSAISPPRRLLALCSPRIQRTASTMLLLPDPFGPTMAVMPAGKSNRVFSAKLLNPISSSRFNMQRSLQRPEAARAANGSAAFEDVGRLRVRARALEQFRLVFHPLIEISVFRQCHDRRRFGQGVQAQVTVQRL